MAQWLRVYTVLREDLSPVPSIPTPVPGSLPPVTPAPEDLMQLASHRHSCTHTSPISSN